MTLLLLAVALGQWTIVACASFFKRLPRSLVASTLILALACVNAFGVRHESAAVKAAALQPHFERGTCSSIEAGMTAEKARAILGDPHEVRDDEKTRGPGATTWIYRHSRCAVHLLDDKVETIE